MSTAARLCIDAHRLSEAEKAITPTDLGLMPIEIARKVIRLQSAAQIGGASLIGAADQLEPKVPA